VATSTATDPRIVGVGTAVPPRSYSQQELVDRLQIDSERQRSFFLRGSIERRHLVLPPISDDGGLREVETQGDLLRKHIRHGTALARKALEACLAEVGASAGEIGHICCVSSTGFISPGFSARLIRDLELSENCSRLDVVGMGCNAGLNALGVTASWAMSHPGSLAVLICVEVCSAAYVFDGTVVNSLFGDGASAAAIVADPHLQGPKLVGFASRTITEALEAMRYDWDEGAGRFSFYLDPGIPYVIGANVEDLVARLLGPAGLAAPSIDHWIVHSGGKKVIDSVQHNLALDRHATRHTRSVLRDYGNLSSASFLFSYRRLLEEGFVERGDTGVMITMGPGSAIEGALLSWDD
jgi:polyketide synthase Type III